MSYTFLKTEKSPRILVEAVKMMGTKEIKGSKHNPEIMRWAKVVGLEKTYTADEIPWCGLAMAYAAHMAGLEVPKISLRALAWNQFGVQVQEAMLGDILTFTRKGGGHVGIYVGEDKDCYHVLGGNQSDAMNVTRILKSRLSQIRRTKWKIAQPINVRKIELDAKGIISKNEA